MAGTPVQDAWVARVLGIPLGASGPGAALAAWKAQRESALTALRQIAGEIAAAKHPSSSKAIIEIQAVIKNLTAEPKTPQQVSELRNYLEADQVVLDVCDLVEDIRTPLLNALTRFDA